MEKSPNTEKTVTASTPEVKRTGLSKGSSHKNSGTGGRDSGSNRPGNKK